MTPPTIPTNLMDALRRQQNIIKLANLRQTTKKNTHKQKCVRRYDGAVVNNYPVFTPQ